MTELYPLNPDTTDDANEFLEDRMAIGDSQPEYDRLRDINDNCIDQGDFTHAHPASQAVAEALHIAKQVAANEDASRMFVALKTAA